MSYVQTARETGFNTGVIDIGSNSVRLVVYDGLKRVPIPLFNEKMLCGLARGLHETGHLHPEGVEMAYTAIARFHIIAKAMHVGNLHIFATAAVRDAKDGPLFIKRIHEKHHANIVVLSGDEEAYYAGLGVLSSIPDVDGIVGDLGGGSLELVEIKNGCISNDRCSLPIGILRLDNNRGNMKKNRTTVANHLETVSSLKQLKNRNFYAVGGGFRALARVHIHQNNYPLRIVDHYTVKAEDLLKTLEEISSTPVDKLSVYQKISDRRVETMPLTAMILEQVIKAGKPSQIVFSAYGVREGVLFEQLPEEIQENDPLISAATDMLVRISRNPGYGYTLMDWMNPLFEGNEPTNERKWRLAACILSEFACYEHTEYRAELAFRKFLDASIAGVDHKGRVFIATALFHRYQTNPSPSITGDVQTLLPSDALQRAITIGVAMRLAHDLSGGFNGMLSNTKLELTNKQLILHVAEKARDVIGDAVMKRLGRLAGRLNREPLVK